MARKKSKGTELNVFKGREAKLNRAILQTLTAKGPQTIYELHKDLTKNRHLRNTRYASVNKRIKALERLAYVRKEATKKTKAGFEASVYEVTSKAYLAEALRLFNLEDLLKRIDESTSSTITAILLATMVE